MEKNKNKAAIFVFLAPLGAEWTWGLLSWRNVRLHTLLEHLADALRFPSSVFCEAALTSRSGSLLNDGAVSRDCGVARSHLARL